MDVTLLTRLLELLTEVPGEEEGLRCRSPLFKKQAVVGLPLHTEVIVAARELVEASLCLFKPEELLLEQLIPSGNNNRERPQRCVN